MISPARTWARSRSLGSPRSSAFRPIVLARSLWRAILVVWTIWVALAAASLAHFQDAVNYYAAGQRLNDGHALYALSAGDIAVALNPPYWNVPLLSPPFIAVLWRPLEAIGPAGLALWIGVLFIAMLVAAAVLFVRAPLAVAISAPGLGYLFGSGNVHGFIFVAVAAAWFFRHRWWIGVPLGFLAAAKLFPIVLVAFLIAERNWRAVQAFMVTVLVCVGVGVLGAGLDATLAYPGILLSSAPQPEMLASILGIRWLTPVIIVGGMAMTALLARRRAFQAAVMTLVFGFGLPLAQSSLVSLVALPRDADLSAGEQS